MKENDMQQRHHGHKGHHTKKRSEITMFTDKQALVDYVNQLESIDNVDVYKIDDNLYKVHVKRSCDHGHCHHDDE